MAMKTWLLKYKWKGTVYEFRAKAGEKHVDKLETVLHQVTRINRYSTELRGFTDEPGEKQNMFTIAIGGTPEYWPVADQAAYEADASAWLAKLHVGEHLDNNTVQALAAEGREIFFRHLPVKDLRKDRDVAAAEAIESARLTKEWDDKQAAKRAEFIAAWARNDQLITIPEGYMAITLAMYFDDSMMETDYFQPHSHIGWDLLLGLVPEGARTERIARDTLARYPELLGLGPWKWDTRNHSGGHGNWLESPIIGQLDQHAYNGRESVEVWWEISFSGREPLLAYCNYKEPVYA